MSALDPANAPDSDELDPPADSVAAVDAPAANAATTQPSPPSSQGATLPARRLPTGPLFCWLLIQLGALALAAGRVPLAARYPRTGERHALDLLLAAQVGFAAMLFPWLLRDLAAAVLTAASCWPALALAVMLSVMRPSTLPIAGGYVTLWLAVLAAWRSALATERSRMIGTAVAAAWAIGGPVVWYLRADFNSPMQSSPGPGPFFGPLTGALAQVDGPAGWRASDWIILSSLLILGLFAGWLAGFARRRRSPVA